MLQFVTEAHALLLALKLAGLQSLEDVPAVVGEDGDSQKKWLRQLATQVVETCWKPPSEDAIGDVAKHVPPEGQGLAYVFCICNEGMLIIMCIYV